MTDNFAQNRTPGVYATELPIAGTPIVGVGPTQPINQYIENLVKAGMQAYVFESNVAETWTTLTSVVSTFLTDLWKEGRIPGMTPKEAFSVKCGLGSTMSAEDVLNGYMILVITLSGANPAEPLEITFTQAMQKS